MTRIQKQPEPRGADLSYEKMKAAIPTIERKISELKSFDISMISDNFDKKIAVLRNSLETFLDSILGHGTIEYNRYHHGVTDIHPNSHLGIMGDLYPQQVQESLREGIAGSIVYLEEIKKWFIETISDAGETPAGRSLKAYEGLDLHPEIQRAVGQLFHDGHYDNAIEDGVKALNALVRLRSGVHDKDGSALMQHVFGGKTPILKFNSLSDASDIDEQTGFMMMFSGAVAGLRNPRAHKIVQDAPEMALEFIAYISLLAKLLDKAHK